jgi:hypothetical protein
MPCALTEPDNYPDYLKSILKKIAVGNDDDLKACACSDLKSPLTDEGCLITDQDGKVGAFPFCLPIGTPTPGEGLQYLELTLKQAMTLFWKVKTWEVTLSGSITCNGGPNFDDSTNTYISTGYTEFRNLYDPYFPPNFTQEKLVCPFETSDFRGFVANQTVKYGDQAPQTAENTYLTYYFNSEIGAVIGSNSNIYVVIDMGSAYLSTSNINDDYAGQCDLSFEGYKGSFPIYVSCTFGGNKIKGSVSMSVRAKEYWP